MGRIIIGLLGGLFSEWQKCDNCHGSGKIWEHPSDCDYCDGSGTVRGLVFGKDCSQLERKTCPRCEGEGGWYVGSNYGK